MPEWREILRRLTGRTSSERLPIPVRENVEESFGERLRSLLASQDDTFWFLSENRTQEVLKDQIDRKVREILGG